MKALFTVTINNALCAKKIGEYYQYSSIFLDTNSIISNASKTHFYSAEVPVENRL
jgi:hypothetical protein